MLDLSTVRQRLEVAFAMCGADTHRYRPGDPLPQERVAELEAQIGAELPAEYRAFLTTVGDGGAGPGSA